MSPNKRIVLNALVTYGRSLVSLALGVFSARWILQALGKSDFGLYGVVGGLIGVVAFIETVLRSSVSRFYAYAIGGKERFDSTDDYRKEMQLWFNTALSLHLCLVVLVVAVGMPLCYYMVKFVLTIPQDRVSACLIVAAISLATTAVSILTAPYSAMFNAKQLIAELTLFDFIRILGMFVGAYALLYVKSDRLLAYATLVASFSTGINVILMLLASRKFASCRVNIKLLYQIPHMKRVGKYAVWKMFGVWGWSLRQSGSIFLINIFFGPLANAAFAVSSQFAGQAAALSSSLMTALTPALTTIAGSGDATRFRDYTLRSCKFSALLLIIFMSPLILEVEYILKLWLKDPPELAGGICICTIIVLLINMMTSGYCAALSADGRIKGWQLLEFIVMILALPVTCICYKCGTSFIAIGIILIVDELGIAIVRIWFSKRLLGIKYSAFFSSVVFPCVVVSSLTVIPCVATRCFFDQGFLRLSTIAGSSLVAVTIFSWLFAFTKEERLVVIGNFRRRIQWSHQ